MKRKWSFCSSSFCLCHVYKLFIPLKFSLRNSDHTTFRFEECSYNKMKLDLTKLYILKGYLVKFED